jgi:hypothetical protein
MKRVYIRLALLASSLTALVLAGTAGKGWK